MRHTDRNRYPAGDRHAHHISFTSYVVAGFYRQVAVGRSHRPLINQDAGPAVCSQACVTYADSYTTQPCLHSLEMDSVVLILRHIPLMGGQGHT